MPLFLCSLLLAAAPFEGVVHMKLKTPFGTGGIQISVGPAGVRSDGRVKVGSNEMLTHVVVKADAPTESWLFDIGKNVWTKQVPPADAKPTSSSSWTGQVLPDTKVAGVTCKHIRLKHANGGEVEYWTTRTLFPDEKQAGMLAMAQKTPRDIASVLEQLDASGFVMKMKTKGQGSAELEMEVIQVEKKKIPADMFDVTKPVVEKTKKK